MNRKSCAFTGHRPQRFPWGYNESDPRCAKLKASLVSEIEKPFIEEKQAAAQKAANDHQNEKDGIIP